MNQALTELSGNALLLLSCRLLRAGKAGPAAAAEEDRDSAAEQDVDGPEHFSDATSSGEQLQQWARAAAAAAKSQFCIGAAVQRDPS